MYSGAGMSAKKLYDLGAAVQRYARHRAIGLRTDERVIFDRFADDLRGARFLDLGVGAGRTTGPLLERVREYVGLDVSQAMIDECTRVFPGARFVCRDARDLSCFEAASFEVVCFSFNGIDFAEHADRLTILSEIRRVLTPGGLLVLSTHNRDWPHARTFFPPPIRLAHPLRSVARLLRAMVNRARNKSLERFTEDYAWLNDSEGFYAAMLYYIAVPAMKRQLTTAGFRGVIAYDRRGASTEHDTESAWIYYTARS